MPAVPPSANVKLLWKEFVRALRALVTPAPGDRYDAAFREARAAVLASADSAGAH